MEWRRVEKRRRGEGGVGVSGIWYGEKAEGQKNKRKGRERRENRLKGKNGGREEENIDSRSRGKETERERGHRKRKHTWSVMSSILSSWTQTNTVK